MRHACGGDASTDNMVSGNFRRLYAWRPAGRTLVFGALAVLGVWALWSYQSGGLLHVLLSPLPAGESRLDALRLYVQSWGALAPLVYVAAVTVEVLVAPIPGTLLYAPAGAIFGGFVGGTLSLAGNVAGAAIACWIAAAFGPPSRKNAATGSRFASYQQRLASRGAWIVFLLRVNPFTSSDLVSYAAGLAGVKPGRVALGTVFGMAPLCYAQAYLAESVFEHVPAQALIAIAAGLIVVVLFVMLRRR
jgi:uncharacterized membrane protein YdjX (TVP38/TMEM64 family)